MRLKSSPPSAAYMLQLIGSALVQIISCHQVIIFTNAWLLSIGPLGTNFRHFYMKVRRGCWKWGGGAVCACVCVCGGGGGEVGGGWGWGVIFVVISPSSPTRFLGRFFAPPVAWCLRARQTSWVYMFLSYAISNASFKLWFNPLNSFFLLLSQVVGCKGFFAFAAASLSGAFFSYEVTKSFEPPMFYFISPGLNIAWFINFVVRNIPIPFNLSQEYSLENIQFIVRYFWERPWRRVIKKYRW